MYERASEPLTLDFLGEVLMTTTLPGWSLKTCYLFHVVFLRAMNSQLKNWSAGYYSASSAKRIWGEMIQLLPVSHGPEFTRACNHSITSGNH